MAAEVPVGSALAAVGVSYVIGSIPTAFLVVKRIKGVDVRTIGSGNVGATNTARVAGQGAGAAVFLIDLLKGVAASVVVARWLLPPVDVTAQLGCGLAAVTGHCFPAFLQFRGGKGVATTIGVLAASMPGIAAVSLGVWLFCAAVWRYVSVASIAAVALVPFLQYATAQPPSAMLLGAALAALVIARHRDNLTRLRQGTEHRLGSGLR